MVRTEIFLVGLLSSIVLSAAASAHPHNPVETKCVGDGAGGSCVGVAFYRYELRCVGFWTEDTHADSPNVPASEGDQSSCKGISTE